LPKASSAVTVKLNGVPAGVVGELVMAKRLAAAGVTVIGVAEAARPGAVTVIAVAPAFTSVTALVKACVPASAAVKV
jgi:hypothetical protein